MNIWVVMAILFGITGFYIFLALYLLAHLVGQAFRRRRPASVAKAPQERNLEPLMSRIKEQTAGSAES